MPKMRAGAVQHSSTNFSGVSCPAFTPNCHRICRRFSIPGPPLGILREVVFAQRLLVGKAEGAVVGGDDGQRAVLQRLPQRSLVVLFAQRRREDVLRLFPALAGHLLFERKHQVLRASLRQRTQAALLRMLELAQGILIGKMHDVHRGARHVRDGDGAMRGLSLGMRRNGCARESEARSCPRRSCAPPRCRSRCHSPRARSRARSAARPCA